MTQEQVHSRVAAILGCYLAEETGDVAVLDTPNGVAIIDSIANEVWLLTARRARVEVTEEAGAA